MTIAKRHWTRGIVLTAAMLGLAWHGKGWTRLSPDFRGLLSEFNAHGVECLVFGAYALAAHRRVRATGDLGVWVRPNSANAQRVIGALTAFGALLLDLTEVDLMLPDLVFQIGVVPLCRCAAAH